MTETLRKEIMIRSKLRKAIATSADSQNYKKKRNKCVKTLKNAKKSLIL